MFFKVLIVLIGVYLLGKMIIRSVVSWFLDDAPKKMDNHIRRQQEEIARLKKKKEGHVTVHYQPKKGKNIGKEDGDYVDFEEVK